MNSPPRYFLPSQGETESIETGYLPNSRNPRHWMATLGHLIALVFSLFDPRRLDRVWSVVVLGQMLVTSVLYWHFPPVKDPKVSRGDRSDPQRNLFSIYSVWKIQIYFCLFYSFSQCSYTNEKSFTEFRCEDITLIYYYACRAIKDKHGGCCVMREFIPKRIHQTHTGSWSLVNWRALLLRLGII